MKMNKDYWYHEGKPFFNLLQVEIISFEKDDITSSINGEVNMQGNSDYVMQYLLARANLEIADILKDGVKALEKAAYRRGAMDGAVMVLNTIKKIAKNDA